MPEKHYDRAAQDIGNITGIGHVNVCISDQHLATSFYVTGLGYTRDPFLNTGAGNMWINVGMSQFHLPMGTPDTLRGVTGLVMPDRAALLERLARVRKMLKDTKFDFRESNDGVETVCPWGNRIHVHEPDAARFGRVQLGMPYVRFDVRPGTAERIARFYCEIMSAPAEVKKNGAGPEAKVQVGEQQYFYFRETDAPEAPYDRHHVQIYLSNFSGPYRKLLDLGLITMETNDYEYRFKDVVDLDTREVLFTVEHETRSQTNPMYGRPLINRNPAATNMDYKPGHDSMGWAMP
jgi:catechol-2,3-dioxygenase